MTNEQAGPGPVGSGNGSASGTGEDTGRRWPEIRDEASARIHEVQDRFTRYEREARQFFRERPLTALGIAVGVGYIVGRILPSR